MSGNNAPPRALKRNHTLPSTRSHCDRGPGVPTGSEGASAGRVRRPDAVLVGASDQRDAEAMRNQGAVRLTELRAHRRERRS
eukprot:2993205-Rhodomonas_salina.2